MPDILHRVGLESMSAADAYKALATIDGLAGRWTQDTAGDASDRRDHPIPIRRPGQHRDARARPRSEAGE